MSVKTDKGGFMQRSFFEIYIHLIWATKNREPMLTPDIEETIINIMHVKAKKHKANILAIGGTENHVHVLISMHPDTVLSEIIKEMKASSSYFVNHNMGKNLYWQDGYGALSVSKKGIEKLKEYINHQKEHHANVNTVELYEKY